MRIATASRDCSVKIWDENFKLVAEHREHSHFVNSLVFIPPVSGEFSKGLSTYMRM